MGKRLPTNMTSKKREAAMSAVTIGDVALAAGVHPASVSRALRGVTTKVSTSTRERIERIAREMGYRPNAIAASLRTRQTNLVAVVVPDLGNPLFAPIVQGVEEALRKQGMLCLIVQPPHGADDRRDLVTALANRLVSGLLILSAERHDPMLIEAKRLMLSTVLVNRGLGEQRFPSVVNDDRESVRLVLDHLTRLGHRAIAHVAGPRSSSTGSARREGFEELCGQFGVIGTVVEAKAFTREAGREATEELLDGGAVSAIFAGNDMIALGSLDALKARGLAVPRDVSLVGHNDMPLVDLIAPPLTTVRVAVDEMARQAAQLLLDHMKMPTQTVSMRVLLPTLIVRESTGKPREAVASQSPACVSVRAAGRPTKNRTRAV